MPTMDLFGGRLLIVADFIFALVIFLRFGFIDAMGSSSDVKSVDPRILIKQSMFLPRVVVCMVWIGQYLQRWWFMVENKHSVVSGFGCADTSWGGMKREGMVGSFWVCDKYSGILVCWRKITPSRITAT